MAEDKMKYVLYIAAPPERVWEGLTDSTFVQQYWFGRSIQSTWKVGDPISVNSPEGTVDMHGEILECDPPRLLSYTFKVDMINEPTRVRIELKPFGEVTRLTLTHEPVLWVAPPEAPECQQNGWGIILNGLKTLLETGKPLSETFKEFY